MRASSEKLGIYLRAIRKLLNSYGYRSGMSDTSATPAFTCD